MQKERKNKKTQNPNFLKSLLLAAVILAVIVGIIILFNLVNLPSWPLIFFLFYFTSIVKMEKEKFIHTSVGGLIGMTGGFLQSFITLATNNETAGLIGLLIVVTVLIALMIDGRVKIIETFCMFMLTILTGYAGGLPAGQYIGCVISYVIAVVLFAVILAALKKLTARSKSN